VKAWVVLLALAAVAACPQKAWFLDAQAPQPAKDTTRARVIVVTASREPSIEIGKPGGGGWLRGEPMAPATWPGTARYLVPFDSQLGRVSISVSCGAGCMECIPPRDGTEYVRIDGVEPPP
jgi:hypothetical protein